MLETNNSVQNIIQMDLFNDMCTSKWLNFRSKSFHKFNNKIKYPEKQHI